MTSLSLYEDSVSALINTINRPFDFHPEGRVPDGNPNMTMQMADYYDDNGAATPLLQTGNTLSLDAIGVMYTVGINNVRNITYDINSCTTRDNQFYGPIYFFIDQSGTVVQFPGISDDGLDTKEDAYFWSNDPVNIKQLVGSYNGFDAANAMTNAIRVLTAGVRFWPTIELVTDSTTIAVSRYYGCQMTPQSLANAKTNGDNIYSIFRNSPSYHEYTNSEGISGRFQPCQQGSIFRPLHLNQFNSFLNNATSTDGVYFPALLARLTYTQSLVGNDETAYTFPVRSFFRSLLECSLNQPTPLQPSRVPYVPDWEDKVQHFTYRNDLYPSIVSGHSFKAVEKAVVAVLGKNSEAVRMLAEARSALKNLRQSYNSIKTVGKGVKKALKPKKKNGKSKNGKGKGRQEVGSLSMSAKAQHASVQTSDMKEMSTANAHDSPLVSLLGHRKGGKAD